MNELLTATGILCLICMIVGYSRGFIKIVVSLMTTVAIIVLVTFLTPYVSEGIRNATPLETMVMEKCVEALTLGVEESGLDVETSREKQIEMIEQSKMPEVFQELLLENNNSEIYQVLGVTTFVEYIGSYLSKIIADIAAFLLTLLVATVLGHSFVYALGWIGKLPVVGGLNRIAGAVFGLGVGLVIIWVVFIVITLLYSTDFSKMCFDNISDSQLLTFLYRNNVLMECIMKCW